MLRVYKWIQQTHTRAERALYVSLTTCPMCQTLATAAVQINTIDIGEHSMGTQSPKVVHVPGSFNDDTCISIINIYIYAYVYFHAYWWYRHSFRVICIKRQSPQSAEIVDDQSVSMKKQRFIFWISLLGLFCRNGLVPSVWIKWRSHNHGINKP